VTDDFIIISAGVDIVGPESFKAWVAGFQSEIAALKWEAIETFANPDGSRVSSRFRITGRNNGMFGLPADGRPLAFTGNAVLAVTLTGKLARNWVERSAWELYNQLKEELHDVDPHSGDERRDSLNGAGRRRHEGIPVGPAAGLPHQIDAGSRFWAQVVR